MNKQTEKSKCCNAELKAGIFSDYPSQDCAECGKRYPEPIYEFDPKTQTIRNLKNSTDIPAKFEYKDLEPQQEQDWEEKFESELCETYESTDGMDSGISLRSDLTPSEAKDFIHQLLEEEREKIQGEADSLWSETLHSLNLSIRERVKFYRKNPEDFYPSD